MRLQLRGLIALASLCAAVAVIVPSAGAADNDAGKSALTSHHGFGFFGCQPPSGGVSQPGFAVIKRDGDGSILSLTVSLQNAPANAVYDVEYAGHTSTGVCFGATTGQDLTTNGEGNGTLHVDASTFGSPDARLWLVAENAAASTTGSISSDDVIF